MNVHMFHLVFSGGGALVLRVQLCQRLRDLLLHVHDLAVVLSPPALAAPLLQVPEPPAGLRILVVRVRRRREGVEKSGVSFFFISKKPDLNWFGLARFSEHR